MARKLLDSTTSFALWSSEAASDTNKVLSLNMTGLEVAKDQMIQLYYMVYPYITSEFVHRDDLQNWAETINDDFQTKIDNVNKQISDLRSEIQSHIHIGNLGSLTSPSVDSSMSPIVYTTPKIEIWTSMPEDDDYKHGELQVVNSSSYTKNILHRDPESKAKNYTPSDNIEVTTIFNSAYKFVPFDEYGTYLNTNDTNFINQG